MRRCGDSVVAVALSTRSVISEPALTGAPPTTGLLAPLYRCELPSSNWGEDHVNDFPAWPADPPTLSDDQVTLRAWSVHDAATVFAACQDSEIQRWTTVPVPYRQQDAEGFVGEHARSVWRSRTGAPFAVVSNTGQVVVGSCALVSVSADERTGEVGYWVTPSARGAGVAQRALRLLCTWALGDGGLARVQARVAVNNVASRSVVERVGFTFDRQCRIQRRGDLEDLAVYELSSPPTA